MKTGALIRREWNLWWAGSSSWLTGVFFLFGSAYFFFTYLHSYQNVYEQYQAGFLGGAEIPSLRKMVIEPYFETIAFLLLFVIPMITAKLFSEDREKGFLAFLFSTPVTVGNILAAKFLGALLNIALFLVMSSLPAFFLLFETQSPLLPAVLGFGTLCALTALYFSLGCVVAQLVPQPLPLALCHFLLLVVLYFLPALSSEALSGFGWYVRALSPVTYSSELIEGLITSQQIFFFIGGVLSSLLLSWFLLYSERFADG